MKKIIVIEDEARVVSFINKGLTEAGFEVSVAFDGKTGLQMIHSTAFDLIILDVMLPDMNGIEICKTIRKDNAHIPILFLTALGTSENVVVGLEAGADDYLVKPFKFIELLARVKSLLRRVANVSGPANPEDNHIFRVADLVLNDYTKTAERGGQHIPLTTTEYRMLLFFLQNKNKVLSRADILENVWGVNFDIGTNVVDVYVNYLRKKIDKATNGKLINTVIGMGYVLRES